MRPYLRLWIAGIVQLHHYCMQQSLLLSFALNPYQGNGVPVPWGVRVAAAKHRLNMLQRMTNATDSQDRPTRSVIVDFADVTRPNRFGDFICRQRSSKSGRGPFQRRSSTVSKTGTSSRRVARVRNNRASLHDVNSDSDSARALLMDGCHSCQSLGMSSRRGY
jgi:hypothetical protein